MLFGERVNLLQGHEALVQAHNLLLQHLHEIPDESVNIGCPIMLCIDLNESELFSCSITPSPVTTPPNE